MNNKMIKGSVAGATGIVLLMGGFGTYAVWSDSVTLPGNSVTSGALDLTAGTATLKDQNDVTWNPGSDLAVPGDVITRLQSFDFTATGKNLSGAIRFEPGAETDGVADGPDADTDPDFAQFGDALDIVVTVNGDDVTPGGSDWCWEWAAPGFNTKTIATSVVFTFNDVGNQVAQKAKTVLADSNFAITQDDSCD